MGLTSGQTQLQTFNFGLPSAALTVQVQDVVPAFFLQGDGKHVVATPANSSLVGPTSTPTGATPAAPGGTIVLYGTGFGITNPPAPEGQLISTPLTLATPPTITIGGTSAGQLAYAGLIGAGLYQLNVTVPAATASGDVPVVALAGSTASPGTAVTAVE